MIIDLLLKEWIENSLNIKSNRSSSISTPSIPLGLILFYIIKLYRSLTIRDRLPRRIDAVADGPLTWRSVYV